MAAKKENSNFVIRLKKLGCPYTDDIDDDCALDTVFGPGQLRLIVTHWLLFRLHPSIYEIFQDKSNSFLQVVNSDVKSLLFGASSLGLCHKDEIDLFTSSVNNRRLITFLDRLLSLVEVLDGLGDNGVKNEVERVSRIFDKIVDEVDIDAIKTTKLTLFPPETTRKIHKSWKERGCSINKPPRVDTQLLNDTLQQIIDEVKMETNVLRDIKDKSDIQDSVVDVIKMKKLRVSLRLLFSQTGNLLTTFSYSYNSEITHLCTHPSPAFSPLGPTVQRSHELLHHFYKLLEDIHSIKVIYNKLQQSTRSGRDKYGHQVLDDFSEYVTAINESLSLLRNMLTA